MVFTSWFNKTCLPLPLFLFLVVGARYAMRIYIYLCCGADKPLAAGLLAILMKIVSIGSSMNANSELRQAWCISVGIKPTIPLALLSHAPVMPWPVCEQFNNTQF